MPSAKAKVNSLARDRGSHMLGRRSRSQIGTYQVTWCGGAYKQEATTLYLHARAKEEDSDMHVIAQQGNKSTGSIYAETGTCGSNN